jgi:hypothetical protein
LLFFFSIEISLVAESADLFFDYLFNNLLKFFLLNKKKKKKKKILPFIMLSIRFFIVALTLLLFFHAETRVIFPNVPDVIDRESLLPEECKRELFFLYLPVN